MTRAEEVVVSADRRTSNRGFASMDEEKQRRIASKGGRSVPNEKRSFSLDRRLAAVGGRMGGLASHAGARTRATGASAGTSSRS
jgi:general stress protein YciG